MLTVSPFAPRFRIHSTSLLTAPIGRRSLFEVSLRSTSLCEGWDSNPGTPTGAGLKPAAFGQAQPPSRIHLSGGERKSGYGLETLKLLLKTPLVYLSLRSLT